MDTLGELIDYITEHNKLAGEDGDIFRHKLPAEPVECVCVIPYGGSATPLFCEASIKNFQILVRSARESVAYNRAINIHKSLRPVDKAYIELKTMTCPIVLKDIPFKYGTSQTNTVTYAFNVTITSIN